MVLQLLRNATYHGIENRQNRKQKGKPEIGSISIASTEAPGSLSISVKDDGRGIDLEQIRQTARKLEKYATTNLDDLSNSGLQELLFSPGFSTSSQVDQNAGRGIGLDLVKSTLQKWGGKIEINTEKDRFCEFRLIIPR